MSRSQNSNNDAVGHLLYSSFCTALGLMLLSGAILASSRASATDPAGTSYVDNVKITVPVACSMGGNTSTEHTATLQNGIYSATAGSDYENGIGKTTLTTFCNDYNGFSIYAVGYTGNTTSGGNNNKLVGTAASGNATISTKVYESTDTTSNWSMKVTKVTNPVSGDPVAYNPDNLTVSSDSEGSFNTWHTVPANYTQVAEYKATTGTSATDAEGGLGSKLETTYAAYISTTQPADTYEGQVKYVMVHPYMVDANYLNVIYNGNGLYYNNDPSDYMNVVKYNATSSIVKQEVTKKSYANGYKEDGSFSGYGTPAGNNVVTIDGASTIHIVVTYGAPQNNGGPSSDLYIWAGNHPDYTNANSATALASCGGTSAVNGAYSSTGASGTQVTMQCDIAGDSVTFYDYSANTNNTVSMGYYAVITGEGDVMTYSKTTASGTYAAPADTPGSYTFFGWSTDPNATEPTYTDEADIITNAPYTNTDITLNLYAVWSRTFDGAFADAGKTRLDGHYKMQDATANICNETYIGATGQLVDTRDNTVYTVGKLKDGKCWLLDNLALDLTNATVLSGMNGTNTHASDTTLGYLKGSTVRDPSTDASGKYATAAVANWTTNYYSYSAPLVNISNKDTVPNNAPTNGQGNNKVGGYYNYCAASAGSYCYGNGTSYGTSEGNASEDICPKGWRLPTGNYGGDFSALANQIYGSTGSTSDATNVANYRNALSLPLSGYFYYGLPNDHGGIGKWWSSTRHSNDYMYIMSALTSSIYPSDYNYRRSGYSVRCVLGS